MSKDYLRELFSDDEEFQSLEEEDQNILLDSLVSDPGYRKEFFSTDPKFSEEFSALSSEDQDVFLSSIGPSAESVDKGWGFAIGKAGVETEQFLTAMTKRALGSTIMAGAGALQAVQEGRLVSDPVTGLYNDAAELMRDDTDKEVKAAALESAFGPENKEMVDTINQFRQGVDSTEDITLSGIVQIREYGKQLTAESERYKQALGGTGQFFFETAANVLEDLPTLAASIYTGTAIPAMIGGFVRGYGAKYGQMRESGFSPLESGGRAGVTGGLMAAVQKMSVANALNLGPSFLKQQLSAAMIDTVGTGGSQVIETLIDHTIDEMAAKDKAKLLDPKMTFWDHVKNIAWNTATNVAAGQVTTSIPRLHARLGLHLNDLKLVDLGEGQGFVIPKDVAESVEPMVRGVLKDHPDFDPQETANAFVKSGSLLAQRESNLNAIRKHASEVDLQPKPKSISRQPESGEQVGISSKFFEGKTSLPINETLPATILKRNSDGTFDVQATSASGEPITYRNVAQSDLTEPAKAPIPMGANGPMLVEFARRLMTPDIPYGDMTPEQFKAAAGNQFFKVVQGIMEGLGEAKPGGKRPTAKIVWDAMMNDPRNAQLIMGHEFGHILNQLTPEAAKALGMGDYVNIKKFFDTDEFHKYVKDDREFHLELMQDLNEMWDKFSLYGEQRVKGKFNPKTGEYSGGNLNELLANAMSVFLNDPKHIDYKNMAIYRYFLDYLDANPNVKYAYEMLQADIENPHDANSIERMLAEGNAGQDAINNARRNATNRTVMEILQQGGQNQYQDFLNEVKNDPKAVELIDSYYMSGGVTGEYTKRSMEYIIGQLKEKKISFKDWNVFLTANNILNARTRKIKIIKPDGAFETISDFSDHRKATEALVLQRTIDENPDASPDTINRLVADTMKEFDADETYDIELQMLSPGGQTPETAADALTRLNAKYQDTIPDVTKFMRDTLKEGWHNIFKEWILPRLKETEQFSPAQLKLMEENSDYVRFQVVAHQIDRVMGRKTPGSPGFMAARTGTTGNIVDPFGATVDYLSRITRSAEKAKFFHDIVSLVADQDKPRPNPGIKRIAKDDSVPLGYEKATTTRYDEYGRVVKEHFAIQKKFLEAFEPNSLQFFNDWMSGPNSYLKSWFTVYNPGFWVTNFFRDQLRTMYNAPIEEGGSFFDLFEIPMEAVRQIKNPDLALQERMVRENKILSGVDVFNVKRDMSPDDRMMILAGLNPNTNGKNWAEVSGLLDSMKWLFDNSRPGRIKDWAKRTAVEIGGRTEFATKAAGELYLEKHFPNMSKEQRSWYVRNAFGTPMLTKKGAWNPLLSNLFLFFNPNMQGLAADYQLFMKNPKQELLHGMVMRRVIVSGIYNTMIMAGINGLFGDDMQEYLKRVDIRHWMRGLVMPTGLTSRDGKSGYLVIPFDQISATVNTAVFSFMAAAFSTDAVRNAMQNQVKPLMEKASFGLIKPSDKYEVQNMTPGLAAAFTADAAAELVTPSVTPVLTTPTDIYSLTRDILGQTNKTQNWLGHPVIPDHIAQSDDTYDKLSYAGSHIFNKGIFGPINAMYRVPYSSEELMARDSKHSAVATFLGDAVKVPGLATTVGRQLKFSNAGVNQWENLKYAPKRSQKQTLRNDARKILTHYINRPEEKMSPDEFKNLLRVIGTTERFIEKSATIMLLSKRDATLRPYISAVLNENDAEIRKEREAELFYQIQRSRK